MHCWTAGNKLFKSLESSLADFWTAHFQRERGASIPGVYRRNQLVARTCRHLSGITLFMQPLFVITKKERLRLFGGDRVVDEVAEVAGGSLAPQSLPRERKGR